MVFDRFDHDSNKLSANHNFHPIIFLKWFLINCTYIYTTVSKCSVYYCVIEVNLYFSFGIPIKQDFNVRLAFAEQSANNVPIWSWHNLLKYQS